MEQQSKKGWLYLLPAFAFLGVFMVYPLIDVFVYSFEEGFNFASQTYSGVGTFNFSYVLHDPYFLQALKNTFILVIITVPLSTGLALLISVALNSAGRLRELFLTVFFLPYVTNTLAVGLVEPGGTLVQASCSSRVDMASFLGIVHRAAERAGASLVTLEQTGQPIDHPVGFPEGAYLKALFARVER